MSNPAPDRPLTSVPGLLALVAFAVYALLAALAYPVVLPSVLVAAGCGVLACIAVLAGFRYWRLTVAVAAVVYLAIYGIRVARMALMGADAGGASVLSGLSFYYGMMPTLTSAAYMEKGVAGAATHIFLEYLMPVLVVVLLATTLAGLRRARSG